MITEQQLADYCSGTLTPAERARFEDELAADPEALQSLIDQERMDAGLRILAGPPSDRATVYRSILEVVSGPSREQVTGEVMEELIAPERAIPPRAKRNGAAVLWQRLAWASAAAVVLLVWRMNQTPPPDHAPAGVTPEVSTPVVAAVAARRDLTLWPFAVDSPWNTPIGADAQFADIEPGGLDLSAGLHVFDARNSHQMFIAREDDPARDILIPDNRRPIVSIPIPLEMPFDIGDPGTIHIVAPDGVMLYEIVGLRPDDTGQLRASSVTRTDLRGSGIPPDFASRNASGLSRLAGSLRREELETGIRRVMGSVASIEAICLRTNGSAHVWPAAWSPEGAAYRQRLNPSGNVHLGTLLAIPPEVNLAQLGVGTNGPAFEIARALQDYGIYVKEGVRWQPAGKPGLIICVASDPSNPLAPDLAAQLRRVAPHLKVVANNGPNSVGGGGARRRPPAPNYEEPPR